MSKRLPRRIWLPVGLGALIGLLLLVFSPAAGAQTPDSGQATQPTQVQATESLATPGGATPAVEATATPGPEVKTVVKITVDQAIQPIPKGDEFEVQVSVDAVEHLAGFSFKISYDPKRVQPVFVASQQQGGTAEQGTPQGGVAQKTVKSANLGQFLKSSGRQEVGCGDPTVVESNQVGVLCNLLGAPLCFGGQPGVSGSGVLGTVYFKSKGGGTTTLTLAKSDLALDNFADCTVEVAGTVDLPNSCLPIRDAASLGGALLSCQPDGTSGLVAEGPVDADGISWVRLEDMGWAQVDYLQPTGVVPPIEHRQLNATVELAKSGGNGALLIGVIAGVVAVVVVGGGAGYLWYRRRQGGSTP